MSSAIAATEEKAEADARLAPRFELPTRNGTVSSDSLRGKVVLVDFWASWCGPCQRSFAWLTAMHERYAKQGLVIVAIDLDKDRDKAEAFLAENRSPFIIAFDPGADSAMAFKVRVMPSSFLVGPSGTVLFAHTGFDPKKMGPLEEAIKGACAP